MLAACHPALDLGHWLLSRLGNLPDHPLIDVFHQRLAL